MTALDQFIRLESIGHWRSQPDAELQEVVVSFGNSTLQLTSLDDTPITHWALRAVKRISTTAGTITFSADSRADEILIIDDPDMIRAIAAVTNEITQIKPTKTKSRKFIGLVIVLAIAGLLSQSPPLIYNWAAKLTSPLRAQEFSKTMQRNLFLSQDFACQDNRAERALLDFSHALFDDLAPVISPMNADVSASVGLTSATVYLPLETVLSAESPAELGAIIAVNYIMSERGALLYRSLEAAGPWAAIQHIFGKNITPTPPFSVAKPLAQDFVAARDQLQNLQIDTRPLQEIAATHGFGLPINGSIVAEPFAQSAFAAVQQYCAE